MTRLTLFEVIGYYESWSDRSTCHKITPTDLPLDALTHLNYAFAYIDPTTFELVTMDPQTPEQLFQTVADVKRLNSGLKVWISVGGWTISDNNTVTQPLFGKIAASAANRQKFAANVVRFCNYYGYDGIDLDWEYPGAPDRGGTKADTQNYVLLLQSLRSAFSASPRGLGISFTVPSSYWYLRWFDMPGMLKYADWINFMTYDLHGVWDRNNPIGSILQGHTNLTEIGYAMELLWRVKVPPAKVVIGFGFYGRSFQVASTSCTKPGCQFTGGAAPGPCSATSGILYL
ncbi:glycoside hydrolase family 18 protein [Aulographum hederae CBS 113979]|uniref:chitinase n=1 Tax=Aulographum hederae CBS 113979 TaxID=1176131 RepID=A0A6G1H6T8_9PEZI|nr:glycoside hydrolase family 18 protein [Aulographum hederae CBS 113979]